MIGFNVAGVCVAFFGLWVSCVAYARLAVVSMLALMKQGWHFARK